MTANTRVFCRPVVLSVLVAVLVSAVTWIIAIRQPPEYEARVDLLASPHQGADATDLTAFTAVTSQSLAATVDVAHGPSVVVDVVPTSLLVRVSARASSPDAAREIVLKSAAEVIAKDLISPVGELRLLDDQPLVVRIAPDRLLAAGLALAAGAAAGVAVLALCAIRRRQSEGAGP
jgi:capsular polysaccharide biosynthesis protein